MHEQPTSVFLYARCVLCPGTKGVGAEACPSNLLPVLCVHQSVQIQRLLLQPLGTPNGPAWPDPAWSGLVTTRFSWLANRAVLVSDGPTCCDSGPVMIRWPASRVRLAR
jgi:hypothetical protein